MTKPGKQSGKLKKPPSARSAETAAGGVDTDFIWSELETVYAENVGLRRSVGLLMVTVLAIATCRFVPHSFALASSVSSK